VGAFWDEIARLRDLLKFEFYFKERDEHQAAGGRGDGPARPSWESRLRSGPAAADELLAGDATAGLPRGRPAVRRGVPLVADVLVHDDTVTADFRRGP